MSWLVIQDASIEIAADIISLKEYMNVLRVAGVLFIGILVGTLIYRNPPNRESLFSGQGGIGANSCRSSSTITSVGHQQGVPLLATSSRRAWATVQSIRVESTDNATNTIAVFFHDFVHNTNTIANSTYRITTTTPLTFGLNTDLPFTGPVFALSDNGTTTVRVSECRYN